MKGLHRASPALVSAVIALLVGTACSAGGPASSEVDQTSPSASAKATEKPTPRPTPSPDDVAAAFLDFIHGSTVPWVVSYTGQVIGDEIEVSVEAEVRDIGESEAMDGTVSINGETTTTSLVRVHDEMYKSTNEGPWLPSSEDVTYNFEDLFENVTGLEFQRVEEEEGSACWWFSATGASIPFGLFQVQADPQPEFTTTRFDIEVAADGTPMAVEAEADVLFGVRTATATYRWEFSRVGDPLKVQLPADTWLRMPDEDCGVSVAFPEEMIAVESGDECLFFYGLNEYPNFEIDIVLVEDFTISLENPWTDGQASLISDWWMRELAGAAMAREVITLDGLPALQSTYRWMDDESGTEVQDWIVVQRRDARVYIVDGWCDADEVDASWATIEALIGSVQFED